MFCERFNAVNPVLDIRPEFRVVLQQNFFLSMSTAFFILQPSLNRLKQNSPFFAAGRLIYILHAMQNPDSYESSQQNLSIILGGRMY